MDCVVMLVSCLLVAGSIWLVVYSRCQHTTMDVARYCCADCGMSIRKIYRRYQLGLDSRKGRFTKAGRSRFSEVSAYMERRVVPAPENSPYTCIEYDELSPDAPPHVKTLYQQMMYQQLGIISLWNTRA